MTVLRKEVAVLAAMQAGNYLREAFADWNVAGQIILKTMKENFPEDGIFSEETGPVVGESGYDWIINPLDDVLNYLNGFKEFGTLLALKENDEVVLGVCYFPLLEEFFIAEKGKGAYCNRKRLYVSEAPNLWEEIFLSDGALRNMSKEILKDIKKFCGAGCRLRVYGSTAFSFTRVALGQAVVAINRFGDGKSWSTAAFSAVLSLLVEEAGGRITDENGNRWGIDSKNLIATNGILHKEALLLFKQL